MAVIRVLLAEDHETVRQGLKLLIDAQADMRVVADVSNGRQAIERAKVMTPKPDVAVLDVSMPELNGLMTTRAMIEVLPRLAVLALTRYKDDAYVQAMFAAGARGYILKLSDPQELLRGIRALASGRTYLDAALTARVADAFVTQHHKRSQTPKTPRITDRESEVLRRIALGHSNKEIATELDISVKTVEVHKANAMRKLNLGGRIDIVRFAALQGWLQDP